MRTLKLVVLSLCLLAALVPALLILAGCSLPKTSEWSSHGSRSNSPTYGAPPEPYINEAVVHSMNPSNSRIEIDLSDQRARLFTLTGELAIETPISTGMKGMETPSGQFHILEKLPIKDSNLYGIWVDGNTGALLQKDGDSRSAPAGGRPQFQGASMPFWLKVTPDGVGMHVGYVASHPISHGCIRVPQRAQALIYDKVGVGTPVKITL